MSEEKMKAEEVLRGMIYQQHTLGFLIEILSEYPSLIEDLKSYKQKGVQNINVGMEHRIIKPQLSRTGDHHITVVINK